MVITQWHVDGLIDLVRTQYPDWEDFQHPPFVADEIAYKQKAHEKMVALLGADTFADLLEAGDYGEIIGRIEQIARATNLLYISQPRRGDLSVLYRPTLEKAEFCRELDTFLHGVDESVKRIGRFTHYLQSRDLPAKWSLLTYLLFLQDPDKEVFVKPSVIKWFLKFVGEPKLYRSQVDAQIYAEIRQHIQRLRDELQEYQPKNMIDVQALIWVAYNASKQKTGRLTQQAQVELDEPPTIYESMTTEVVIAEPEEAYRVPSIDVLPINPPYPLTEIEQYGFDSAELERWVNAIERKKQAIFYGPPGTGKTFAAQQIAQHLIAGGDGFIELIQFHSAYAYEDFVQGLRPVSNDGTLQYEVVAGHFRLFCEQAMQRAGLCVLIIDEINRANLARVFGELMFLLEYREREIRLAGGNMLQIPANVRIIGTMNTADRSIALVDHALRRRFAFIRLAPNYEILRRFHRQTEFAVERLIALLQQINTEIEPAYQLGTSFFLTPDLVNSLADIWQMEIEPYLEEYFFDQPALLNRFRWQRVKAQLATSH